MIPLRPRPAVADGRPARGDALDPRRLRRTRSACRGALSDPTGVGTDPRILHFDLDPSVGPTRLGRAVRRSGNGVEQAVFTYGDADVTFSVSRTKNDSG